MDSSELLRSSSRSRIRDSCCSGAAAASCCASICAWPSHASANLLRTRASDDAKPDGSSDANPKYFTALMYASFFCCQTAEPSLSALSWDAWVRYPSPSPSYTGERISRLSPAIFDWLLSPICNARFRYFSPLSASGGVKWRYANPKDVSAKVLSGSVSTADVHRLRSGWGRPFHSVVVPHQTLVRLYAHPV